MQRTKKRPDSMPGFQIGTSYLLVIFIILCLVTFAALALSSALRDQSYSQALAKHQTEYAAASTQASSENSMFPFWSTGTPLSYNSF